MSVKGLPKLTAGQYKMMNGQLGSVIIHKGELIPFTMDGQWRGIVGEYPAAAPSCNDTESNMFIDHDLISLDKDTIIDGRFLAWQIGGECWLYITPYEYLSESAKLIEGKPLLVHYHKYK
jgi:hypothetical protein